MGARMLIKAVFHKGHKVLGEFPILVEGEGDLSAGAKEAYAEFRRAFPSLSIFDEDIRVTFEKLE